MFTIRDNLETLRTKRGRPFKISEKKNLLIVQIVQFKNSNIPIESIDIDGLKLKDTPLNVSFNDNTRIFMEWSKKIGYWSLPKKI